MASSHARSEVLRRERTLLALLVAVGAGALGVGLYGVYRAKGGSIASVFDLALGASVLLVTWFFLAPSAVPEFSHDPSSGRPRTEPMNPPPVAPPSMVTPPPPKAAPRNDVVIPKWADPLVMPRSPPARHPRGAQGSPAPPPVELRQPRTNPRVAEPLPAVETTPSVPVARLVPAPIPRSARVEPRWLEELRGPAPQDAPLEPANDIIRELDRIEAELRDFVPIEGRTDAPEAGVFDDAPD